MNIQELIKVLEQQKLNLSNLKDAVVEKQTALISRDFEKLQSAMQNEEKFLLEINNIEKERVYLISQINRELKRDLEDTRIKSLVSRIEDKIDPKQKEALLNVESSIKAVSEEIRDVNQKNMYLINHARDFINETINSLLSNKQESIFDRRV
jgi:flagellar biosynthesis/type III secretory pathway chaperone